METVEIRIEKKHENNENLECLSKEELIEKIKTLRAHNIQLKNLLNKKNEQITSNERNKIKKPQQKPFDFSKVHFRHVLLKFFYLGWEYDGYVVQEDTLRTIEHRLFDGLVKTCLIKDRQSSNYHRCGRTDKGVSAFSQVVSIDLRSKFPHDRQHTNVENEIDYCDVLNRVLPDSIQCTGWCPVPRQLSARFDCRSRTYKYFFPKSNLDIQAMNDGLKLLVGTHDFRNLCKMDVGNGVTSFERNIAAAFVEKCDDSGGKNSAYDMYRATITAKAFLWHQIRCVMAVTFLVGQKKEEPDVVGKLLDVQQNPRKPEYSIASEMGLNLFHCEYERPDKWIHKTDSIEKVIKRLYGTWSIYSSKTVMIKSMLDELEKLYQKNCKRPIDYNGSNGLFPKEKSKSYKSLMKRQKCEALEDRIEHFMKKRKLTLTENVKQSSEIDDKEES